MRPRMPVMLCALLALLGHGLLLWQRSSPDEGRAASRANGLNAVHITLLAPPSQAQEAVDTSSPTPPPPLPDKPTAAAAAAETGGKVADQVDAAPAPIFFGPVPEVALPDALLPDAGVQVHAFVHVAADGRVIDVVASVQPADADPLFQGVSERALANARFQPTPQAQAYCLQLEFRSDISVALLGWQPTAIAQRCLRPTRQPARMLPSPVDPK